jgi:hypothetical protein
MAERSYDIQVDSSAPIEIVFEVIADAPGWARWVKGISRSEYEVEGDPAPGGVGAIRSMGASRGKRSRELVVAYEEPTHYAYEIVSGVVPVKRYRADVRLIPTDTGTHISWSGSWNSWLPGIQFVLTKMVGGFAAGAAREAERLQRERA